MNKANDNEINKEKLYWENLTKQGYRPPGYEGIEKSHLIQPVWIEKYLQPTQDKVMFEVGCGWGKQTKLFADMFKIVIAEDVSATMIGLCKAECADKSNIVYCEYPEQLKNLTIKFDCTFSYGVLQYCTDEIILKMQEDLLPHMNIDAKFLWQFAMFRYDIPDQKTTKENGRSDIMRNPHEVKALLEQGGFVMDGYEFTLCPTLQVWAYGHKKG